MNQLLHLFILDLEAQHVLVEWRGSRWMVPALSLSEHFRAGPSVVEWGVRHGLRHQVVGQWVGRPAPNVESVDWLLVTRSVERCETLPGGARWTSFAELEAAPAFVTYQAWALAEVLKDGNEVSVPGPFGTVTWPDDVRTWVEGALGESVQPVATPYKTSPHEVVLGFSAGDRRVYFRGLSADRASEASTTAMVTAIAPDSFPSIVATQWQADGGVWSLTSECPGRALIDCLSVQSAASAAAAFARLQQMTAMSSRELRRHLSHLDLQALAAWGAELLDDRLPDRYVDVIEQSRIALESVDVPDALVAVDLDPTNVFLLNDEVRFIDLDELHHGSPPIAIAILARRVVRALGGDRHAGGARQAIYDAYSQAWLRFQIPWPAVEIVSALLETWLGLRRVETMTLHGEVFGMRDLARQRVALRLAKIIDAAGDTLPT